MMSVAMELTLHHRAVAGACQDTPGTAGVSLRQTLQGSSRLRAQLGVAGVWVERVKRCFR